MLKIGVFGTGRLGKLHLNNWREIPEVELIGFCDPDEEAAAAIIPEYGLKRFTSPDSLIEASDAIDIVSPAASHFDICERAIKKSRHVMVEKPMGSNMKEARDLLKLVRESKIKFQVGHSERFNPAFLAARSFIHDPFFIEMQRHAQFNPEGTGIDVVLDLMIHDIALILTLVKSEVKNISANGVSVLTNAIDTVSARLEFNNGCVVNFTSGRIAMADSWKMKLYQKGSYMTIDFLELKTEVIRIKNPGEEQHLENAIESLIGNGIITIYPPIPESNAIKIELEEFVKAITTNKQPAVNEIDGFRTMEVAHQILQKIHQNPISS